MRLAKNDHRLSKVGVFQAQDAERAGISRTTLARLVEAGQVERVGRGLYLHSKSKLDPTKLDFAVACAKFGPKSVIGGLTALFHYDLIEQVPTTIWVLVPYEQKTRQTNLYRCLRTKLQTDVGVADHGSYRITTVERSVVEAFRYATKIGVRTAVHAARTAIARKLTTQAKILRTAKELKLEKFALKYWEAVIA